MERHTVEFCCDLATPDFLRETHCRLETSLRFQPTVGARFEFPGLGTLVACDVTYNTCLERFNVRLRLEDPPVNESELHNLRKRFLAHGWKAFDSWPVPPALALHAQSMLD